MGFEQGCCTQVASCARMHRNCNQTSPDMRQQRSKFAPMGDTEENSQAEAAAALPPFDPTRQVGWIFRDGGCVALERRGDEHLSQAMGE